LRFGRREALRLFASRGAFPHVVSALAISHKTSNLLLSQPIPSDFTGICRPPSGITSTPGLEIAQIGFDTAT